MTGVGLLDEVIEAHGGRARWQSVDVIEASLSSGGLAFASRLQPYALRNLQIAVQPHLRRVELKNYCRAGWRGIWTPTHVEIRDGDGAVVSERRDPRNQFGRFIKLVRWDKLDMLYFAGYALWNYLSFPFLLESPGVEILCSNEGEPASSRQLTARFSEEVPTHSALQTFHIDHEGLLTRHDYTADLIGRWATAANRCLASAVVAGLRFYTRRRVTPRFGQKLVLPLPTLVWIELDNIRLGSTK